MELYTMRYALAVAEYGNFSLAAQACHVGQPALSQQIAKLEKELGVSLFYRSSRGAVPTEAGADFIRCAQEIIQLIDALQARMASYAGVQKGTLHLGTITSLQCINFGGLLSAFCGQFPNISVNVIEEGTYRLVDLLLERSLDVAYLNRPMNGFPPELEFEKLGEDTYSVAIPTLHPLAGRGAVSLKELKEERFIFHQAGQVASELCLAACRRAGFEPNIVCRSSSPTTGLYMVRGGLGVAMLPAEDFRSHTLDGITELKLKERIVKEVGIAWRRGTVSPLANVAIRFSKEWVSY